MITVKDVNGETKDIRGGGFGLGLAGTIAGGLALLNQGGLGVLNGGAVNGAAPCMVTEREFYCTELNNRDREFANYNSLNDKYCQLAQRLAVDETAIQYQNRMVDKQFECVDKQMAWDRIATTYQIDAATCGMIKGVNMLPLNRIGDTFKADDNYLATYTRRGRCGDSANFNTGCGGCGDWNF